MKVNQQLTSTDTKGATGTHARFASAVEVDKLFEYCIMDVIEETCAAVLGV